MTLDGNLIGQNKFKLINSANNIRTLVNDTCNLLKSQASVKGVQIKTSFNVRHESCSFDKSRVQQVLINLLSNAIKFSHENGMVFVHVQTLKKQNDEADTI